MRSTASIWIQAPPDSVYTLVSDLSRWQEHLPHYRYVRILERKNGMVVRNMTTKVTEIGQVYVVVPVPESVQT